MNLTDEQWKILEPLISKMPRRPDGRRRPWHNSRVVLNGILWILHTGTWASSISAAFSTCSARIYEVTYSYHNSRDNNAERMPLTRFR